MAVGPCAKQTVTATIVAKDGSIYIGTNWCGSAQEVCPRADMPTGVGYHLCKEVCQQDGHAEIDAIKNAGGNTQGATLFLRGHTYACDSCMSACNNAGIEHVIVL